MDEEFKGNVVKFIGFRKGQGFADEAAQTLAQGVIPAFDVIGQARLFANGVMIRGNATKDSRIGRPKVAEGATMAVSGRNPVPELPTTGLTAVATPVRNHLTGTPTQRYPQPALVFFEPTNDHSSSTSSTSAACASAVGKLAGKAVAAWRNQLATVCRVTPNVRSNPRRLLRSWYARRISALRSGVYCTCGLTVP